MKAIIWQNEDLGAKFDIVDIPDDLKEKSNTYRKELVEAAVEEDEKTNGAYLEGKEPSDEDLIKCIRKGTLRF
jgi:elongation factor G